ncbi:MAG: S-layer homology domain-containing protein [Firmicutes bacterium]|nr:S-layer homology domain-containing protein [Bacillota bacterium]
MKKGKLRILSAILVFAMTMSLCVFPALAAGARVTIRGGSSMTEGESMDLTATVTGDFEPVSYDWSSSDNSVLSVSGSDYETSVYANGSGTATVYVEVECYDYENDEYVYASGSKRITVKAAQEEEEDLNIRISTSSVRLDAGERTTVSAYAVSGDSGRISYQWESADRSVATVRGSGENCTITAVGSGTTTVYVNATRGSGGYGNEDDASLTVTVTDTSTPLKVTRGTSKSSYTIKTGESMDVSVKASGGSGSYRYEWISDGSAYATGSSASATVYGRYEGYSEVICTVYDAKDSSQAPISIAWTFEVTGGKMSASLDKTRMTLSPGETDTLTMSVSGGSSPYTYYWSSDNENVATVSGRGSTVTIRGGNALAGNNRCVISACAVDASGTTSETLTCVVTLDGKIVNYNASASATVGSTLNMNSIARSIASEYQRQFGTSLGYGANVTIDAPGSSYGEIRLQDGSSVVSGRTYSYAIMQDMYYTSKNAGSFSTSYMISENGNIIMGRINISNSGGGASVRNVDINKTHVYLDTYSSQTLRITVTPSNAYYTVSWSSSNSNIASVYNSNDDSTTVNTHGREGSATITATVTDSTGARTTAKCVVEVEHESSSTYNPTLTWTLGSDYYGTTTSEGMAKQFKKIYGYSLNYDRATIRFSDTGNSRYGIMHLKNGRSISANTNYYFYEWVDMYFEPVAVGTWKLPYTINYQGDTLKGTLTITINGANINVKMDPTSINLSTYSSVYVNLTVSPKNYRSITWTSNNTNIATVSGNGLTGTVTSKGTAGTATITAAVVDNNGNRVTKNCTVKVASSSAFNPSVATTYGKDYTGIGTSEAMAAQYQNLYGTSLNNDRATIRFSSLGDNNIGVLRLANGSAAQANKDYTFAEYIKMSTETKASGTFTFPYVLTYNGKTLNGNVVVNIAPATLNISLSTDSTEPKTLSEIQVNGTSATAYINDCLRNAVGGWSYITFSNATVSSGTMYKNSSRSTLNSSVHVTSSDLANLYYVPNNSGTGNLSFSVYNSTNNLLGNGILSMNFGNKSASETFVDVPANSYYADAVSWAVKAGVTSGMTPTTFEPNGTVTRAQAVSFLWRSVGEPAPYREYNPFIDVPSDTWYTKAVLWAVEQGIVYGTTETTFAPNSPVTREQMLTFLSRTEGVEAVGPDVYKIAVAWAEGRGLLNGIPGTFVSNAPCPRCEVVYYIWKLQP